MEITALHALLTDAGFAPERAAPLAQFTTLGVGGTPLARVRPAALADVPRLLALLHGAGVAVRILGGGSNLLVADGRLDFAVVHVRGLDEKILWRDGGVDAGADVMMPRLARDAQAQGRAGLEFLVGLPGCVGGGVIMNAGAWGSEIQDVFQWADVCDVQGVRRRVSLEDAGYTYRHSALKDHAVILAAGFSTAPGDPARIAARMKELLATRAATQPQSVRTGGSTFKNPQGAKAGRLLEEAGLRGFRAGAIGFSEKHANFLVNYGGASSADVENLIALAKKRVQENSGIELEEELIRWN